MPLVRYVGSPARAGIGPSEGKARDNAKRFPRASGDRPHGDEDHSVFMAVPPRERG